MEICDKHKKEYQAYCYDDSNFLCVDCMLDQSRHKNHKMENLKEASRKVGLIIQHHLTSVEKALKAFDSCPQKWDDFRLSLDIFTHKIMQKVHFNQLKIIKQVNESFEALGAKLAKKFEEIQEQANKVNTQNKDGLAVLQGLADRMHKALQTSNDTTLIFKYHALGLAKENVDNIIKKTVPSFDFPSQKNALNETTFLTVDLSKTIDKVKSEITYKNPTSGKKSASFISFSKDHSSNNPSFAYVEENYPITPDVLKVMATDIQEAIIKNHENLGILGNGKNAEQKTDTPPAKGIIAKPQFLSRRSVNMFEPVAFKQNPGFRRIGSYAKLGSNEFKNDIKKKTQALSLSGNGEKAIIIGGTKSKDFTLKVYDFSNGNFEHRKTNFPAVSKAGVNYYCNSLYIFGGKINGRASDKVLKCSLVDREITEIKGLYLTKKKYDFGFTEIAPGVILLFGGKDELKFPIADIELLDLNKNMTRVIGKMGQPKFGVFALKLNPNLPIEDEGIVVREEAEFEENYVIHAEPGICDTDRLESNNVSFNVSRLDSRPSICSHFKYSFEQNPCELSVFKEKKMEFDEQLDDEQEFERFELLTLESPGLSAMKSKQDYPDAKILIIGGQTLSRTILSSIEMFNMSLSTCTLYGELKEARKGCWATQSRSGILIFGGKGVSRYLGSVEAIKGRKFFVKTHMPTEKAVFRGILRNDEIVLMGGKNEKGALNIIETYQLAGQEVRFVKKVQTIPSFANFEVVYQPDFYGLV